MPHRPRWQACIQLLQQKPSAFRYLNELFDGKIPVNYVEVALDLITADYRDAVKIQEYLDRHLVRLWRGNRKTGHHGNTSYAVNKRWVSRNRAMYSGRPSKIIGAPCCHVELRFAGTYSVQRNVASGLSELEDIDLRSIFERHIRLKDWEVKCLGRHLLKKKRRRKPWSREYLPGRFRDRITHAARILVRGCVRGDDPHQAREPNVQDLIDDAGFNVRPCLLSIDSSPLLP